METITEQPKQINFKFQKDSVGKASITLPSYGTAPRSITVSKIFKKGDVADGWLYKNNFTTKVLNFKDETGYNHVNTIFTIDVSDQINSENSDKKQTDLNEPTSTKQFEFKNVFKVVAVVVGVYLGLKWTKII